MDLYSSICLECSKVFTKRYSTSFSRAVAMLHPSLRGSIYAIYGFVRVADEIVDTFHNHPKQEMLAEFRSQVFLAIDKGISTNPILHSFQLVVHEYEIPHEYINSFLESMEMDISKRDYTQPEYQKYIYGSAEVVGLMCLKVFCKGNKALFNQLVAPAQSLGEAFQKVNFLRDLKSDYQERGRVYFPDVDFSNFSESQKKSIETDIETDLRKSLIGIKKLPVEAKLGVYVAYLYFKSLLCRIKRVKASKILSKRIRVPNHTKLLILAKARLQLALGLV
jgi:15-cis-phytoene synthase